MQTNIQAKNLEQKVRDTKVGVLKRAGDTIKYEVKKYGIILATGIALSLGGGALTSCESDYEESKCCQELECAVSCVDTTNYKDYCVKDDQGNYSGCCYCSTPDPNPSY